MTDDGILLPPEENLSYSPLFVRELPAKTNAFWRGKTHETVFSVIQGQL
jgi:hypothetical protein